MDSESHREAAFLFLRSLGIAEELIDPETPLRMHKGFSELLSGYFEDPKKHLKRFDNTDHNPGMVILSGEFTSMCDHHVLPFSGQWWIGYIPKHKILGASKFQRVVDTFARRLQTQEKLSKEICTFLENNLETAGVIVVMKASHSCMKCRGVKSSGTMTTSAISGVFMNDAPRMEFLHLIGG